MNGHRVQHTSSTAPSQNRQSLAASQFLISRQMLLYSTLYISTITSWPMNTVSAAFAPPSTLTASKYSSTSACPNSLNHGLPVHPWVHSISVSNRISKHARSRPQSASLSSLDLARQVHLQTRSITASECISEFTWSRPPCAPLNSLDHGLQVYSYWASPGVRRHRGKRGGLSDGEYIFGRPRGR